MEPHIAVIGCGRWGKNHVRNFSELGALRTVCDASPKLLSAVSEQYPGVQCETSYDRVLSDDAIKGIVLATPAAKHYEMAKAAMEAGKDVLVEKPLALRVEDGEDLVRIADETGRVLMIGHLLHYHPAIEKLNELVSDGVLGKIFYISSNRLNLGQFRNEENILWSFAPHDISVTLLLLNEFPESVSANGGSYLQEDVADVTTTDLVFPSGTKSHIYVNWLHPFKEQKLVVIGDRKMAVFDDVKTEDKLTLHDYSIRWNGAVPMAPASNEHTAIELETHEPLRKECQHFLDCIETRQTPKTDGRNGLAVLRVLDASQRSLESDGRVISLTTNAAEKPFFVHETAVVDEPAQIGRGAKIWHFSHVMANARIGEGSVLGQNVYVGPGVSIGNNVKIQNNVSVYEGVTLEDDVFCGPSCVFTNVINPRADVSRKDEFLPTLVMRGASIGANATIVCGTTIGRYAFVGAGAVVTRDVPDHALVYGNPARIEGWICECGVKIDLDKGTNTKCGSCGRSYNPAVTGTGLNV